MCFLQLCAEKTTNNFFLFSRCTRLLVFAVREGVELCILCDSGPSLVDIEMTIENYWSGVFDALEGKMVTFIVVWPIPC